MLLSAPALACQGQVGKTVFDDDFSDDSGGWNGSAPDVELRDGVLTLRPNPRGQADTSTSIYSEVPAFAATEGDYCVEFILPKPPAPDNDVAAGLFFWAPSGSVGTAKKILYRIYSDRTLVMSRYNGETWTTLFNEKVDATFDPSTTNSLRVVVKDGRLTCFVNGKQIKVIRAQVPDGEMHFGVYGSDEKKSPENPAIIIKSFKVTTGS